MRMKLDIIYIFVGKSSSFKERVMVELGYFVFFLGCFDQHVWMSAWWQLFLLSWVVDLSVSELLCFLHFGLLTYFVWNVFFVCFSIRPIVIMLVCSQRLNYFINEKSILSHIISLWWLRCFRFRFKWIHSDLHFI